ncbi:MBL fold metallo-hydrolase [Nonomuraea soli]|uniref:Cft2 family RNA processing exonuclease n=1 Tax=Nonomuraea soli TaxID=1032476 RepID=A0A7W0HTA5_9ACTN|nr:MBL fold metallo-hydrolase [Nonomuraea soli]MBA2894909.1 Cft2 family RNA processing exonuclease [Nonomuraea soli]
MNAEPLASILREAAVVFLSRPGLAGTNADPDEFAEQNRKVISHALATVPALRSRVSASLCTSRRPADEQALATVVLSPQDDMAVAGLRLAEILTREQAARQSQRKRFAEKAKDYQARLETARGRERNAVAELAQISSALAEVEKRSEELDTQVAALQRRLADPRSLASALLGILHRESSREETSEDRDPRNTVADKVAPLRGEQAAAAAGITPEALYTALQNLIAPRLPSRPRAVAQVRERHLRVRPLGGAREIGGSCMLVEAGGTRILIDAGLRPGENAGPPRRIGIALEGHLDAVVVTHAHTDHSGFVPALAEKLPGLRVIATPETCALMPRMWADSARLMSRREELHRQWGSEGEALYGSDAVQIATERCEDLPVGISRTIGDLSVELFPAGHILGAAGVVLGAGDQRVVITGDISGFRQETVDGYSIPESAREPDLLMLESTCCFEEHTSRETRVSDLLRAVEDVHAGGGRILIPAFALGRAQELALLMSKHLPHVPVLVDGMAADISAAFERITRDRANPLRILDGRVRRAQRPADLSVFTQGVVITTSGMLTGGPAIAWAQEILPDPRSALFLSGYQDEESAGARLLQLSETQAPTVTINDRGLKKDLPLRARVQMMRLSAHADKRGLLEIVDEVRAREVMLVHGLAHRQREFAKILDVRGHVCADTSDWH